MMLKMPYIWPYSQWLCTQIHQKGIQEENYGNMDHEGKKLNSKIRSLGESYKLKGEWNLKTKKRPIVVEDNGKVGPKKHYLVEGMEGVTHY